MNKYRVMEQVRREKIVAIARVKTQEQALAAVGALIEGGIRCIELPVTVPYAHTVLENVARRLDGNGVCLGAGSILDAESARIAIMSGAKFLVTPTVSEQTIRIANRYGIPVFPGVATATEALLALECGVDAVKLFPAAQYSPNIIKDLRAPLPNLEIIPVGGVNAENLAGWLQAGAFACGIGGSLLAGIGEGDLARITRTARTLTDIVKGCCHAR